VPQHLTTRRSNAARTRYQRRPSVSGRHALVGVLRSLMQPTDQAGMPAQSHGTAAAGTDAVSESVPLEVPGLTHLADAMRDVLPGILARQPQTGRNPRA
jgi:hypothetical protein